MRHRVAKGSVKAQRKDASATNVNTRHVWIFKGFPLEQGVFVISTRGTRYRFHRTLASSVALEQSLFDVKRRLIRLKADVNT